MPTHAQGPQRPAGGGEGTRGKGPQGTPVPSGPSCLRSRNTWACVTSTCGNSSSCKSSKHRQKPSSTSMRISSPRIGPEPSQTPPCRARRQLRQGLRALPRTARQPSEAGPKLWVSPSGMHGSSVTPARPD